jgi:imidazolonepropionase-like amidohydrolase
MHKESTLGQIRKGYLADLLVLDANPLTDIGNTRKIDEVIVRGKQFDKAALKRML